MKTPLDFAFTEFSDAKDADAARPVFLGSVARADLFLLAKQDGQTITPRVFDIGEDGYVLAFDTPDRLAGFAGDTSDFVALKGRDLAAMLLGQGLGLYLNPDGDWAYPIEPEVVDWLADQIPENDATVAAPDKLFPARGLEDDMVIRLSNELKTLPDMADAAYLAELEVDGKLHLTLFFLNASPDRHPQLSQHIQSFVGFSNGAVPEMDVGFVQDTDQIADRLSRISLRLEMPKSPSARPLTAPGSDPENPPNLR